MTDVTKMTLTQQSKPSSSKALQKVYKQIAQLQIHTIMKSIYPILYELIHVVQVRNLFVYFLIHQCRHSCHLLPIRPSGHFYRLLLLLLEEMMKLMMILNPRRFQMVEM